MNHLICPCTCETRADTQTHVDTHTDMAALLGPGVKSMEPIRLLGVDTQRNVSCRELGPQAASVRSRGAGLAVSCDGAPAPPLTSSASGLDNARPSPALLGAV